MIFIVLLIYGGFLRMTAQGNPEAVKKSTGIITSAIVGILIILISYSITAFVLANIMDITAGGTENSGCTVGGNCVTTGNSMGSFNDQCECVPSAP